MPKLGEVVGRLTSGPLTLEFHWGGDRFEHRVASVGDALTETPATGIESPVYQEVHQQGGVVFASGMSDDRHWSASVEGGDAGFLFDVACRAKSAAENLGVGYAGDRSIFVAPIESAVRERSRDTQRLRINPPAGDPPYTVRCKYRIVHTTG